MRWLKRVLIVFSLVLFVFVCYTLVSTGFFRTIKPQFEGELLQKVAVKGAEDIMISVKDSFALISSTDRRNFPPKEDEIGGLYWIDLTSKAYEPILLTTEYNKPFAPHGFSFYKKDITYKVLVVNHTLEGHSIEVFELSGKQIKHMETLKDASMIQPNDVVMIDENRFYFTNDHKYVKGLGKLVEEYSGMALSNVVYFDGENYKVVAEGIAYANGINFDRARNLLFVASPRHFLVKVYSRDNEGNLTFIEDIPCETGVDNIEFDSEGNLWIGAHPNLLRFNAYAKGRKETAPSEVIKIDYRGLGDYILDKIYVEDGEQMSGSTVAAVFEDLIFVGNVMDDEFLILKHSTSQTSNQ